MKDRIGIVVLLLTDRRITRRAFCTDMPEVLRIQQAWRDEDRDRSASGIVQRAARMVACVHVANVPERISNEQLLRMLRTNDKPFYRLVSGGRI